MCGIAGIVYKNLSENKEDIITLTRALAHRGPDGEGFYYGKNFALGHRRLAILDISDAGIQPMKYVGKNGEYLIVFNGEIYNYIELKKMLVLDGYAFNTQTDTEVILAAYDKWGFDCLAKFNGMWAFVIYDSKRNILFGARDRFGVKPFYYYESNNVFAFASEIKALLKLQHTKYSLNEKVLFDYLVLGYEEQEESIFKGISELSPSYAFLFNLYDYSMKIWKYYELKYENKYEKYNKNKANLYSEAVRELIFKAVSLRLRSDVPVGSCLSGGLDSSSIVCVISEIAKKEFLPQLGFKQNVFTASYQNKSVDESKYAKLVVEKTNADWHITYPTGESLIQDLQDLIYYQEVPFGSTSIYAQYKVMQLAKEKGVKVLLDGQGGDELFTGYHAYYPVFYKELFLNFDLTRLIKEIRNLKNSPVTTSFVLSRLGKHLLAQYVLPQGLIPNLFFATQSYTSYYNPSFLNKYRDRLVDFIESLPKTLNEHLYQFIIGKNLKTLLRYEDRNSMRFGIEARTPFADDVELIEYVFQIPSVYKIHNGWSKYLLRKSMKNLLPRQILLRRDKIGFATPEKEWLMENKSYFEYVLYKCRNFLENFVRLNLIVAEFNKDVVFNPRINGWRIINLALWYYNFIENKY